MRMLAVEHRPRRIDVPAVRVKPSADDVTFSPDQLQFDEQIRVVRGDLKGLEGGYYKSDDNDYLVFMLGKLGNIKVRVSIRDCALK